MGFPKNLSTVSFAARMTILMLAVCRDAISTFAMMNNSAKPMQIKTDSVAIFSVITLLLIGTRVRDKDIIE